MTTDMPDVDFTDCFSVFFKDRKNDRAKKKWYVPPGSMRYWSSFVLTVVAIFVLNFHLAKNPL